MKALPKRLDLVLDKLTERISEKQSLSMRKLSTSRNEEIQFGRFIGNKSVNIDTLRDQLYSKMSNETSCSHCLLIEDTSTISFSLKRAIKGLGKVDKGQVQGFYVHPVLAIDANDFGCLGVASLDFIKRDWAEEVLTRKQIRSKRSKTAFEDKESYRWLSSIKAALPQCKSIDKKTVIADREADIYPVLTGLVDDLGVDYVIRSRFDRPTKDGTSLLQEVNKWSAESCYQIEVPATDDRSAHKAKMVIKYGQISLKQSEGKTTKKQPKTHITYIVEVKELAESVVNNEKPIHWVLMSSHPVESAEMALQIVEYYKQRWNIEQVFRTLKNKGLRIESSQLESYEKLQKITILAFISAIKVLQLIRARDGKTQQQASIAFDQQQQECIVLLNKQVEGKTDKLKNPYQENTLAFSAWVIARLAGWSGYKSQRPPGPIDFLTGLQIFEQRFQGYCLAKIT
jgi:Transposase DDE domain